MNSNGEQQSEGRSPDDYERFLELYSRDQLQILRMIRALLPNHAASQDVFQETCLELWRSFPRYQPSQPFLPWAAAVARHQVLRYWRRNRHSPHGFSEGMLEQLGVGLVELSEQAELRQQALRDCVAKLAPRQRDLLQKFYHEERSAGEIAKSWKLTVHAVYKALKVTRKALAECVSQSLAEGMQ